DELLGAYASSGAIHVLAVSGLHIGILYAVITFVFGPLRRYSRGKWVLAGVSLLCLWSYAFITGMSPSVLRAVTMFTFVSLAEVSNRRSNIYNTLALSAFCLLLYDPYFIMSVGFQLSYLAVLGIVYLYPRLIFLWTPPSWLIPAWKITCVSVSAQLATFPLGLLYFHQFPVYFLVSNLFVIPLSFLVLVLGLIVLALNVFAPVVKPLGVLLTYVIKAMNAGVLFTEQLPGSLIKGIHITTLQYWFLFGLVVTVLLIFRLRKYKILYASLALAICFSIIQWKHFLKKKKALIVYNVRGHFAMDIFDNGRAYHFADSVLLEDPQRLSFQVNGNRVANAIYSIQSGDQLPFVRNLPGCRLVRWENLSMIQITDKQFTFTRKIPVDYVVISRNAVNSLDQIREKVDCREVIVDSSNSWWVAANLIHEAEEKHQGLYSVLHQGALVKEL
ncbi:MAG TPA: ComEC/Rec2 family competence protein, partial [Cyclobacteriaceae bacterium]|nr:ComEC/Rec2 family competence protein [Cyclobacteriaceae bacterium]